MANADVRSYRGNIVYESWVLDELVIDMGLATHFASEGAAKEIQRRLDRLGPGKFPVIFGGFVERTGTDGKPVPATRPDIHRFPEPTALS